MEQLTGKKRRLRRGYTYEVGPVGGKMTKYRVVPARQCASKHWGGVRQCQGVCGHKGPHWSYDFQGWLHQWKNKKEADPRWIGIASSDTAPDHWSYIHPKDKQADYYRSHDKRTVVSKKPSKKGTKK